MSFFNVPKSQWPFGNLSEPTSTSSETLKTPPSSPVKEEKGEDHLASEQQRLQDEVCLSIEQVFDELKGELSVSQIQSIFSSGRLDPINYTCLNRDQDTQERNDVASELSSHNMVAVNCENDVYEVQCQTCGARMSAKLELWSLPGFVDYASKQRCDPNVVHPHDIEQVRAASRLASKIRVYTRGFEPSNNNHENQRYSLYSVASGRFPHRMVKLRDRLETWSVARELNKLPYRGYEKWSRQGLYIFQAQVCCAWCDEPPSMDQLLDFIDDTGKEEEAAAEGVSRGLKREKKREIHEHVCKSDAPRLHLKSLEVIGSGIVGRVPSESALAQRLSALTSSQACDHNRTMPRELFDTDVRRFGDSRLVYAGVSDLMICCECLCICAGLSNAWSKHRCPSASDFFCITDNVYRAGAQALGMDVSTVASNGPLSGGGGRKELMFIDNRTERKRVRTEVGRKAPVARVIRLNHDWSYSPTIVAGFVKSAEVLPGRRFGPDRKVGCLSRFLCAAEALREHELAVEKSKASTDALDFRRLLFV
ncbi:hypothetical protein [Crucian carp herpesvirus]|uniref:ORF102 n=1 Tax=Cyprinid herpesvirus 2 TaxID=317878 RepID=K7PBP7_CYHV2|nr:protein ORF102 [Cyprinid herpesvirus 2]APB92949.1 hypothetical protein [Crucian carp herpesvirus]AFJ20531.1 protein ORF102 [Cyprinid herpesvirus 2]AKC02047.1 hypothetical protein [Cyprinid herpesvirus 2]AMB21671.1 ORF102 [Cyprinid herpesvirus 2]QAU54824.1 protein ORF102 [Cyprinid herpesvirus 2]